MSRCRRALCAALLALTLSSMWACASQRPAPALAPTTTSTHAGAAPLAPLDVRWYGWEIIPLDVLAILAVTLGVVYDEPAVVAVGATTFGLGAPAVHLSHGHPYDAALSLGARVLAPSVAAGGVFLTRELLGDVRCGPEQVRCLNDRPKASALITLVGAAVIAPALDLFDLAWETVEVEVQPTLLETRSEGAVFGVSGRF